MNTTVSTDSSMDLLYPPSPANVPDDLRKPSSVYMRRAWLAVLGLSAFFILYLALIGWFVWIAYHLVSALLKGEAGFVAVVVAIAAILLASFMVRALFFAKQSAEQNGTEVREQEQPLLFAFLYRLADEVGAPRPYRVYLSPRVNAAVFYDLSILNLVWPSRRNLEIGLGLVNVLTLTELKAVIAHEYGHFAQRSLVVGRWVYISAQIAGHLVTKRYALDLLSEKLTRVIIFHPIGLLTMAFGWTLRVAVWSIRTVTDAAFRLLVLVQRALSREMEFQADLVAVSVTGSDPLVHALHKMQAAEDAWRRAWVFAGAELKRGIRVPDVFALQSAGIARLRAVLGMPDFGRAPTVAESERGSYRLFKARFAQPPKMWMTHPPSFEREENCKRRYVATPDNALQAWALFKDGEDLRARTTTAGLKSETASSATLQESVLAFDRTFDRPYLDRAYRGVYLGRTLTRNANDPAELVNAAGAAPSAGDLSSLYPMSLQADAELQRELTEERNSLQAIEKGTMTPPDGIIRYRGRAIGRAGLAAALESTQSELDVVSKRIADHDRQCRSAHLAVAGQVGIGWDVYLTGLIAMLHYAEHVEANLLDARGYLGYVIATVSRQGKIGANDVPYVAEAAQPVFLILKECFDQRAQVVLDPMLAQRFGASHWPLQGTKFELPRPVTKNIGAWLKVIDSWVGTYLGMFQQLRYAALDELLATEAKVAKSFATQIPLLKGPPPSQTPKDFTRRPVGTERERNLDIDWLSRWQAAGGPVAAASRLLIALSLIIAISWLGLSWGSLESTGLKAKNHLATPGEHGGAASSNRKAVEQESASAQNNLGVLYSQGKGVEKDPAKAVELFRKAAERGDAQAQANLGTAYLNGTGVAQDYAQALTWLQRASDKGIPQAQFNLSVMYLKGLGVAADPNKGVEWLRKAADQGLAAAQNNLGVHYLAGDGVAKDESQAATWYRKAADQKYAVAETNLGILYTRGQGVPKDDAQAFSWFQQAAAQGDAQGQLELGASYDSGRGVAKDSALAAEWVQKSADQGLAGAQFALGILYTNGRGVPKDLGQALLWYQKAADQGLAAAQNNLGLMYLNGIGTQKDLTLAVALFRKASAQEYRDAQCNLGIAYLSGLGVDKDAALAAGWVRKAAEGGLARAQGLLGSMYLSGWGVPKDLALGSVWILKAANAGDPVAQLTAGQIAQSGTGVPKDETQALVWYRKAAQQGNAEARARVDKLAGAAAAR